MVCPSVRLSVCLSLFWFKDDNSPTLANFPTILFAIDRPREDLGQVRRWALQVLELGARQVLEMIKYLGS